MDTASTTDLITGMVGDVGTILYSGIGSVLTLVAVLVGLGYVVTMVYRRISRPR